MGVQRENVLHFPSVQLALKDIVSASETFDEVAEQYCEVLNRIGQEFEKRFCDFRGSSDQIEPCVSLISNAFMNVGKSCVAEQLSATLN